MKLTIVGKVMDHKNDEIEIELTEDDIKALIRQKAEEKGVSAYIGIYWTNYGEKITDVIVYE